MTILIAKFRFLNQINPWEEKYACWTTYLDNKKWKKLISVHFRAICFLPSFCEADTRTSGLDSSVANDFNSSKHYLQFHGGLWSVQVY